MQEPTQNTLQQHQHLIKEIIFVDSGDFMRINRNDYHKNDFFVKLKKNFKCTPIIKTLNKEIFNEIKNSVYSYEEDDGSISCSAYSSEREGVILSLKGGMDISEIFAKFYSYNDMVREYEIFVPISGGSADFSILNTFVSKNDPSKIIFHINYTL